ncbi:MAG: hypothetical protein A2Y23_03050 [Clostridiales bacterium GWB2_37_7]|nr:MAG: hypothetical protein A2Y23_03050 [Clostridiales bacterium GWB2_37_7]
MQNAVDIVAIVQKSSMLKQKFDVPSKTLENEKASFRKEFSEARKGIVTENKQNKKAVDSYSQRTTENKAEKHAKIMSSSNPKAEVKDKKSVEALEQTDVDVAENETVKSEATEIVEKPEETKATDDTIKSIMEMIQQLMQTLEALKKEGSTDPDSEALKTALQGAIQKLEQVLNLPMTAPAEELHNQLESLKIDIAEFAKQLEVATGQKVELKQIEPLIKDFAAKLNRVGKQLDQVFQQIEKPRYDLTALEQASKGAIKQEKQEVVKLSSTASEINQIDKNQQIEAVRTDNTNDSKINKESKNQDEAGNSYKNEATSDNKQALVADKLNPDLFKDGFAPQNEKLNFQLNVKQVNTSVNKDSMVKINSTDIMNQVIKKVDILVQGAYQEMIMKLEPESLGKLNLKLVVENGLITAKFIAESQQVKEVLESSFNQLKDALQEKGVSVQSLSVSVGQQGSEFNSSQSFEQWKRNIKLNSKPTGEYMELDDEISINVNPYNYHEGKVDYRA